MPTESYFMNIAQAVAQGSKCKRRQVGAVIVSPLGQIMSTGYNGTPRGTDNTCEDCEGKTRQYVLHAELNAILYAQGSLMGCTIYVTTAPCSQCAAVIMQKGINRVVYGDDYHSDEGIKYMLLHGISVKKI